MTQTLKPPTKSDPESSSTAPETFPYSGGVDRGSLPTPDSISVLRSRAPTEPDGDVGSFDCPACGTETINGAGLFTCPDCEWTGTLE